MAQPTPTLSLNPPLSLESAVKEIKQSYESAVSEGEASPFFFVTGAGISVPQVPLAQEIIRDCKKQSGATEAPVGGSSILDEYSRCLEKAFPGARERQRYFQKLIRGKPIPAANFRLAHLLLGEKEKAPLASLVVTTNFDDFLARALQLFGKEYVLCDSPSTAQRLRVSNADRLQIVHVHGTYYFYDIKNLSGEVEAAAAASKETTATMSSLLEAVLREQSPIVVGYGGWDGDVFMKELGRRLRGGPLPQRLYWCCYRRNEWQSLPEWLRMHSDVRFVEPEEPPKAVATSVAPKAQTPESGGAIVGVAADLLGQNRERETFLDAQSVFEELIKALEVKRPELTENPIEFFADQLTRSLPRDATKQGSDLYRIKSTVEELRAAAKWIHEYRQHRTLTEQQLHAVREQLRGAKYVEAMRLVIGIDLQEVNEQETDDLWEMAWEIVNSREFDERPSDETLAMVDRFEQIAALVPSREETPRRVVKGLTRRALHLAVLNRAAESAKSLLDLVQRSRQTDDPAIRVSVGEVLYQIGVPFVVSDPDLCLRYFRLVLSTIGESENEGIRDLSAKAMLGIGVASLAAERKVEAVDALGAFLSRVGVGTSTFSPELIAQVSVFQAAALKDLGRWEDAIAADDEVVRRFGDAVEPGIREQVAKALVNKGDAQKNLTPAVDNVATYDEVVRRFGEASEPGIREQVATALLGKGITLNGRGQTDAELNAYEEVVRRFGEASEPGVRVMVAMALVNKGMAQGKLTSPLDPVPIYDEVVRRFGEATEPGIQMQVARALIEKGGVLRRCRQTDDALNAYDEVLRRFGEASESVIREQVARALVFKGVTLHGRRQPDDELNTYDEVVRRFGEATEPDIREQVATALVAKGLVQGTLTPPGDDVATYDEVVRRFGEATEPGIREMVARALVNKGLAQEKLTPHLDPVATYDEVVRRFGEATEPGIREQVATALVNKGIAQEKLTPPIDPVTTYDEVVRRFGEATEPGTREQVARALVLKGVALNGRDQPDDELNAYDEVVRRFGEATEPGIREMVARALVCKGLVQGNLTPPGDAVATYDEVVRRFGEATEPGIREMVATALLNKGITQGTLNPPLDPVDTYDEVVRRFGEDTEPGIREQVGNALNSIAFHLLCEAKATWNREGQERAIEGLRQAAETAERALQYLPSSPMVLGNKGYALFLAGETEAGAAALREAIKLGGEETRQSELDDAEIHALPLDEEFKKLVRSIPAAG